MRKAHNTNTEIWENLYGQGKSILSYPCDAFVRVTYRLLDLNQHKRVLDYGFGSGANMLHLASRDFEMHGVEVSKSALTIAKQRFDGRDYIARLSLIEKGRIPYPNNYFDFVYAWQVLYYNDWLGLGKSVAELERVLRPGGLFLATMGAEGDISQKNADDLGDCLYRSNVEGQQGALLLIVKEGDLPRCFPERVIEIGELFYRYGSSTSRHFIVTYKKP